MNTGIKAESEFVMLFYIAKLKLNRKKHIIPCLPADQSSNLPLSSISLSAVSKEPVELHHQSTLALEHSQPANSDWYH